MTAPSPLQNLIGTIFKLQELRQRDEAAQLAREQFGLEQTRVGLSQQQMAEQGVSLAQNIAENSSDPSQFLKHVDFLSAVTGTPQDVLRTTLTSTPPSAATTRNKAVAAGAQSTGGALDAEAYAAATTGQNLGGLAKSSLDQSVLAGAQAFLGQMDPTARAALNRRVVEKQATGLTPEQATLDTIFEGLPRGTQTRILEVGKGLLPNADAELQARVGLQELGLRTKAQEFEEQRWDVQLKIMQAEAAQKLAHDPDKYKTVQALTHDLDQSMQDFIKNSNTLTPAGIIEKGGIINSLIRQIQALDPTIPVPPPIKPGEAPAATSSFLKFMSKSGALP